jgi:hypothetical protein
VLVFSSGIKPIPIGGQCSKLVLTDMKVVVTPDAVKELEPQSTLIVADGQHAEVSLENCTFEAAADSPKLVQLTVCAVGSGAQVG